MKYPQLVSIRAVNAISDWLVSRLEQLGVEAPHIYSRLLLSLLQSSVQINDPIEFNNKEAFFANRKGSHRRYSRLDTNTLKKINAVQCLKEIVSSEQEITALEALVDELFEKLNDIERQSSEVEDDDNNRFIVATLCVSNSGNRGSQHSLHYSQHHTRSSHGDGIEICDGSGGVVGGGIIVHNNNKNNDDRRVNGVDLSVLTKCKDVAIKSKGIIENVENDAKKRYFHAFPALTKEMESSFRVFKKNSLTWPTDNKRTSTAYSDIFRSDCELQLASEELHEGGTIKGQNNNTPDTVDIDGNREQLLLIDEVEKKGLKTTPGIKRKSKRRRNKGLTKGKSIQSTHKCSGSNSNSNSNSTFVIGGTDNNSNSNRYHRSSSPFWDTDFEGCWEMGRDLIKEFIVKQNNRNRSTSEGDAYINSHQRHLVEDERMLNEKPASSDDSGGGGGGDGVGVGVVGDREEEEDGCAPLSPSIPLVDMSFYGIEVAASPINDKHDDTLVTISKIANASFSASPKRFCKKHTLGDNTDLLTAADTFPDDDDVDFTQFKAKFDSSLKALWKSSKFDENGNTEASAYATVVPSSLPKFSPLAPGGAVNLQNFWTKYNNHRFDVSSKSINDDAPHINLTTNNNNNNSLNDDSVRSKQFNNLSLPWMKSRFEGGDDFFSLQAGKPAECYQPDTPVNVFLQNSIWSENWSIHAPPLPPPPANEKKVWNFINQKTAAAASQMMNSVVDGKEMEISDSCCFKDAPYDLSRYSQAKWSEGINVGPNIIDANMIVSVSEQQQQQQQQQRYVRFGDNDVNSTVGTKKAAFKVVDSQVMCRRSSSNNNNNNNNSLDCTDSSSKEMGSGGRVIGNICNWETPRFGQSVKSSSDMQSWSSSDAGTLTEMYCCGAIGGNDGKRTLTEMFVPSKANEMAEVLGPKVTLENHSPNASGFLEYARIKTIVKITKKDTTNNNNNIKQHNTIGERAAAAAVHNIQSYGDDENLLTSDLTHFRPIKTYPDGHSFDICSALDVVDYERSESGYLHLESDKYLQYTRNDAFLAEEDTSSSSGGSVSAFGAPLYASSNCEANSARKASAECNFVIKFRLQNNDVACQTDEELRTAMNVVSVVEQRPVSVIHYVSSSLNRLGMQNSTSTTAPVVSPAFVPATNTITELSTTGMVTVMSTTTTTTTMEKTMRGRKNDRWLSSADTYRPAPAWALEEKETREEHQDGCGGDYGMMSSTSSDSLQQQWSMHEIGKKCELQGYETNPEAHTLWGVCSSCINEYKSIPAYRMLKDELQVEADEIMNDLKYMQDLYISEEIVGDSDTDCDTSDGGNMRIDGDEIANNAGVGTTAIEGSDKSIQHIASEVCEKTTSCIQNQADVFYKVNRLIADLLSWENVKGGGLNRKPPTATIADAVEATYKSCHLSKHGGGSGDGGCDGGSGGGGRGNGGGGEIKTLLRSEDDKFLSNLKWEYDNLAEIWERKTPANGGATINEIKEIDIATKKLMEPDNRSTFKNNEVSENVESISLAPCDTICCQDNDGEDEDDEEEVERKEEGEEENSAMTTPLPLSPLMKAAFCFNGDKVKSAPLERVDEYANAIDTVSSKYKNSNRKRRHSAASQNILHLLPLAAAAAYCNVNNNVHITDLNQLTVNIKSSGGGGGGGGGVDSGSVGNHFNDFYIGADEATIKQPKQTIITCKYWATIDPILSPTVDVGICEKSSFPFRIKQNKSILQHVSMVTRPLTR